MTELLLQTLGVAYGSVSVVTAIGYWPTIRDLFHRKLSANAASYLIWTATSGITFLYSLFILPDFLFRVVSAVNFGSCAAILLLCANLEYRDKSHRRDAVLADRSCIVSWHDREA